MNDSAHRRIRASAVPFCGLLAGALMLVAASPALASPEEDRFEQPGVYVGVSGIYSHNFFDSQVDDAIEDVFPGGVNVSIDDSFGVNARVGYRAASWFAIELEYEYIDAFDVKAKSNDLSFPRQKIFSIEGNTITVNTRWIAPIWRTQPYLLLGAGLSLYESRVRSIVKPIVGNGGKQTGFAGRGGGGIDLYLSESIVLNTEATVLMATQDFSNRDAGNVDDLWYVSIGAGLRYQF